MKPGRTFSRAVVTVSFLCATGVLGLPFALSAQTSRSRATQVATEVFRGSEFWWKDMERMNGKRVTGSGWLERAVDWLLRYLLEFLRLARPRGNPFSTENAARYGAWALILVCVVLIVTRWRELWSWLRPALGARERPSGAQGESADLPDVEHLLQQAGQAIESADTETAFRLSFLAVIAVLEARGVVPSNRAKTNWEHIRSLEHSPTMRDRFLHLATPYERVYYGRRPAAVGEARTYLAACRALVMDPARP